MAVAGKVYDGYMPLLASGMLDLINFSDVARAYETSQAYCHAIGAKLPRRCPPRDIPVARLNVRSSSLACNLLDLNIQFASARLREALQAPDDDVFYLPVDSSACPPQIRDLDYKLFYSALYANPIDMDRSVGYIRTFKAKDGTVVQQWTAGAPGRIVSPSDSKTENPMYWREDFTPPGPIFSVPYHVYTVVSDETAERVMRAGVDDVEFYDPFETSQTGRPVYKTL